ncbi:FAD-binding oxidoreductase [Flaviaesturariibacter flavus]|uniref:FAD-binding oxidoreductase n=1 Tax=Flaviaesturariibacter flavus TaxID=2502780 RepID=A0A4R1BKR3_9BACT|nr:FAD-binding oxidoreductase [Flaviaesturariibacter flavus]TCJ17818.1 FAD-binding oxidoreductase [Flaviaesturariibacter flavus]
MQLHTPHTYSLEVSGPVPGYEPLQTDADTEVLVIGAGISGALVAYALQRAGTACLLIDRRDPGMGSTAASTSLLQYELDTPLTRLGERAGTEAAERCYRLCYEALPRLKGICEAVGAGYLFKARPSLQFASMPEHLPLLQQEYEARRALGIDLRLLNNRELLQHFGIDKPGALLSAAGAAIDAYAILHCLLQAIVADGGRVSGNTDATHIHRDPAGVTVETAHGKRIRAQKLVIACGYESQRYLPRTVEQLSVTYALASERIDPQHFWYHRSLIWETARPYHYLRCTPDNRIIIGGEDTPFDGDHSFPLLGEKTKMLEAAFRNLFPRIPFRPAFSWAGLFAGTADGMPYIGPVEGQPHTFYALGFGGNGILFSVLAADIICGLIRNGAHPDAALFSFERTELA